MVSERSLATTVAGLNAANPVRIRASAVAASIVIYSRYDFVCLIGAA
jgi:hypothetical protein